MPERQSAESFASPADSDVTLSSDLHVRVEDAEAPLSRSAERPTAAAHCVDDLPRGYVVGNYAIEGIIDVGGGGVVYSVRHKVLGRRAALKALREDAAQSPSMVARFVREAEAVNRIAHPNIVDIYEFGEIVPGRPYYVMELLEGTDLRKLLRQYGRFSPEETFAIFEPVCRAVHAAHQAGIVHRDIKSSNVILVEQGGQRIVKLVDFGIAKPIGEPKDQGLTEPGLLIGTAHNMAPEHIRGGVLDARTDVYGLGILAFQMLTGHYPFDANEAAEIAMQHLQMPAPRPSATAPVSAAVDAVVLRCLEKSPDRRFGSVSALLEAFRTAVGRPSDAAEVAEWGVGIYFEMMIDADGDMDDDMLADVGNVLDTIEQGLASSSFIFPFHASNALLGVRVVGSQVDADLAEQEAEAILTDWRAILAARPDRHPNVRVAASLSVGQVLSRHGGENVEIVGGSLLDFNAWKDSRRVWTS